MYKKRCHRCQRLSYSLSDEGRWICPTCGDDLTHLPVMAQDSSTANVLPVSRKTITGPELN